MKWPASEIELGRPVVAWLESRGYRVRCEVQPAAWGGPVADVVATRGPLVWIVELKTRFGFAVIDQAAAWIGKANRVSVAVPAVRGGPSPAGCRLLESYGVGLIEARGADWSAVREVLAPRTRARVQTAALRARLAEIDASGVAVAAGTPSAAGRWTRFRQTCMNLTDYVRRNPGCTLKAAIEGIAHHYSSAASARGSLADWIDAGRLPGVSLRREAGRTVLYPSESTPSDSE